MDLFNWMIYPSEYRYLTVVFGCKQTPSLETLNLLRLYTLTHNRYPNIDDFVLFATKECEVECEFYLPIYDLIDLARYSLVELGFFAKCRMAHYMYSFRTFEHRYPNLQELHDYLQSCLPSDSSLSQIISGLMDRDTQEYWEKKQSGLTEQDIYKYVQTNEEKDLNCCVCQEEISPGDLVIRLGCNHSFHRGSSYKLSIEDRVETQTISAECQGIEEWLKRSASCPICRNEIKVTSHHP